MTTANTNRHIVNHLPCDDLIRAVRLRTPLLQIRTLERRSGTRTGLFAFNSRVAGQPEAMRADRGNRLNCRNIASLTMSAVSSPPRAHHGVHSEKSAISLSWMVLPSPTVGSLVIVSRSGTPSDPCISSVRNRDHDSYFELLVIEERDAQSITRCSTPHHRDFRAVPRANRT